MKRRLAVLILTLFLIATSASVLYVKPAMAGVTIYIRADGTIEPSGSPISTVDHITYTLTSDINGWIVVERSNVVIAGASHLVSGDGTGNGFTIANVNNVILKNARIQNFEYGVYVESAPLTVLQDNLIEANSYDGVGLLSSNQTLIQRNNITTSGYIGIECIESSYCNITGNRLTGNLYFGIGVYYSEGDRLVENALRNNYNGLELGYSTGNLIYRNSFINHTFQVSLAESSAAWDNGYDGNYWSDYTGADTNGDGIGESPLAMDPNNIDRFPLMNPFWNLADVNHDLRVDMRDIGIVAAAFGGSPGNPKWNPHADITGRYLIPDGVVDMRDIGATCALFGARYAP